MVFIALAAAPTFSARAGPTKIIVKRIAVFFSLSGVVEARSPAFYAVKIYKFATKITKIALSYP
ncbi:hypothetical protein B6J05_22735 [Klebsiella quasipneumoniae]|nr:hypothetical protein DP204_24045 [Klebsiella quasipneumoniae subsp. quasipneumoniae]PLD51617.1 hypothetical protein B6I56_13190 [Klebsiella quasipneumoniae]PLF75488.1 hypothetical protein B6I99_14685 [Klebsiella quasipneumoniae]PLG15738.1 hypothetical protein B6J05_22735 [Klebsiella quasipneumoniae]PLJ43587.1 hypothetical protein B6J67_03795 [Klebsiella quasipneumoniae]